MSKIVHCTHLTSISISIYVAQYDRIRLIRRYIYVYNTTIEELRQLKRAEKHTNHAHHVDFQAKY